MQFISILRIKQMNHVTNKEVVMKTETKRTLVHGIRKTENFWAT